MSVVGFAVTGIVLGLAAGLSPGPLLTLVVQRTLQSGWIAGALVAIGMLVADLPVVAGTAWFVAHSVTLDRFIGIVSLAGAAFLVLLGLHGIRVREAPADGAVVATEGAGRRAFGAGFVANLLNPNLYLFWGTVGLTALAASWQEGTGSVVAYLVLFYVALVGSKLLVAGLVTRGRRVLVGRGYIILNRTLGALLLVFAVRFFAEGLRRLDLVVW